MEVLVAYLLLAVVLSRVLVESLSPMASHMESLPM
jgi:hypothetical protein